MKRETYSIQLLTIDGKYIICTEKWDCDDVDNGKNALSRIFVREDLEGKKQTRLILIKEISVESEASGIKPTIIKSLGDAAIDMIKRPVAVL